VEKNQKHSEKTKKEGTSPAYFLVALALFLFFVYLVVAIEFRTENLTMFNSKAYVEVISVSKEKEGVNLNQMYPVKVQKVEGYFTPKLGTLYVPPKFIAYFEPGSRLKLQIEPNHCATWLDFFKLVNNTYNYTTEDVYSGITADGKRFNLHHKAKEEAVSHLIAYVIVGVIIALLFFTSYLKNAIIPSFSKDQERWEYHPPHWLSWLRMGIIFGAVVAIIVHVYEGMLSGKLSSQFGDLLLFLGAIIFLIIFMLITNKRKNDYLSIDSESIKYMSYGKEVTLLFKSYDVFQITPEFDKDNKLKKYKYSLMKDEQTKSFNSMDLSAGGGFEKVHEMVCHFVSKAGLTVQKPD
jgi:hypothetical protein